MKTNATPILEETRNLFGVVIRQNTKNCMLSLTDLQEAYARAKVQYGWKDKKVNDILNCKNNIEKIYFTLKEKGKIQVSYNDFSKNVKESSFVEVLKTLNVYKTYGRGNNRNTFCEFNIWMLVCMELHPSLYAQVLAIYLKDEEMFDTKMVDIDEIYTSLNHEKAWKYFYPEGNGKAKKGFHLHHINPRWRHEDIKRYNQWNIEDLQMMTASEHMKLHKKLGDWQDIQEQEILNKIGTKNLSQSLSEALLGFSEIDRNAIFAALNTAVFGKHETGIRNKGSEKELGALYRLEDNIAFAINRGFVKTMPEILSLIKESADQKNSIAAA